jgi:hypothetical protein
MNRTKAAHTSIVISVWALKTSGNAAKSLTEHHQFIWMRISVALIDEGGKRNCCTKEAQERFNPENPTSSGELQPHSLGDAKMPKLDKQRE